jgi:adenosylhomocysteine nucleosidase
MRSSGFHFPSRYAKSVVLLLTASLILSQCGCGSENSSPQPYLILYAFDAEGEQLAQDMSVQNTKEHLGRTVRVGQLAGQDVVLVESGVGMTNAAMMTQSMIDQYHPQAVIMTGIAGAVDDTVDIGDIVVCAEWIQHDYGYEGSDGFEHSELSAYDPSNDSIVQMISFPADINLLSRVKSIRATELNMDKIGSRQPELIIGGIGVSGNTFIDSKQKRERLAETFCALIVDMESAAVAHVCSANNVPFIIFRSASDLAGGSGSETAEKELEAFFKIAANNSSQVVMRLLKEL